MAQLAITSKTMPTNPETQRELREINDQLKLALRDYKITMTKVQNDPEDELAKEEVHRISVLINTLAQSQKSILKEIRRKVPETSMAEAPHKSSAAGQSEAKIQPCEMMSSKEKENEGTSEPTVKTELDIEMGNGLKKEQSEIQEPEVGKSLMSVAPLGERPKHVDNMLPNNENGNSKPSASSAKIESDYAMEAVKFFAQLELMPTEKLKQELRTTERKRATRQKRSTANHSQFVYDDSWDQDDKKKRKKDKEVFVEVPAKIMKPNPEPVAEQPRLSKRKQDKLLARQQMIELDKKNEAFKRRKSLAPFSLSSSSKQKLILPKPANLIVTKPSAGKPLGEKEQPIPATFLRSRRNFRPELPSPKEPHDFSVEKQTLSGWNTTILTSQQRDTPNFASSINSLIEASDGPPGLSLKIPGLPSSLTIERIPEKQRVCCMCRKPALITGMFGEAGEQISDALTSCGDCGMTYHLSCTRSTSTSNKIHVCPHCFNPQPTYSGARPETTVIQERLGAQESRKALIREKIRLITEKESLDKKLLELGTDVTCTFTSGGKPI